MSGKDVAGRVNSRSDTRGELVLPRLKSQVLPLVRNLWDHRVDCFFVGVLIGMLSTWLIVMTNSADTGFYVGVFAGLTTLSPLGLRRPGPERESRRALVLSVTRRYALGVLAVVAGLLVGGNLIQ